MSSLEEGVANVLVVVAAAQIKEIDCHFPAGDVDLLDSVVDSDGGDILLDESALAVPFDDAGLADAGVSDRDELSGRGGTFSRI